MEKSTPQPPVTIRLRIPIARDYERRGVFANLRFDVARRVVDGAVEFLVEPELAAQVLADARAQYQRVFTRDDRGIKKSYGHFIQALRADIEPEVVASEAAQWQVKCVEAEFEDDLKFSARGIAAMKEAREAISRALRA